MENVLNLKTVNRHEYIYFLLSIYILVGFTEVKWTSSFLFHYLVEGRIRNIRTNPISLGTFILND